MTSFREEALYNWLKDLFITIQKSQEINKEMGIWERAIKEVNKDETDEVCRKIAKETDKFVEMEKARGIEPTNQQIINKMKEVLNKL